MAYKIEKRLKMTKEIYVGVNDESRKITSAYIGGGGVARKIRRVYIGESGKARLCYDTYTQLTDMTELTTDMFEEWRGDTCSKVVYYNGYYVYTYGAETICFSSDGINFSARHLNDTQGMNTKKVLSPNTLAVTPEGLIWVVGFDDPDYLGAVYRVDPTTQSVYLYSYLMHQGEGVGENICFHKKYSG